jgi:hypothetical protein
MAQVKETRLAKKAKKEVNYVKLFTIEITDLLNEQECNWRNMYDNSARLEQEIAVRAKKGEPEFVLKRLLDNLDATKEQCEITKNVTDIVADVKRALTRLYSEVNAMFTLRWYKPVIRSVPKRKIHSVLDSEDCTAMEVIIDIVEDAENKIIEKLVRSAKTRQEGEERVKKMQAVANEQLNMYTNANGMQSTMDRVNGIIAKQAVDGVSKTIKLEEPINVVTPTTNTEQNQTNSESVRHNNY